MSRDDAALAKLAELLDVVYRLRDPDGCPWDREQTLDTMIANLLEEAAETADALAARDDDHVAEELGDVLMNVFLMARIADQERRFDLARVASDIAEKLVRRHPHVFGDREAEDAEAALASWNESKAKEGKTAKGALDGVPASLPALLLAARTAERAAAAGFAWPDLDGPLAKLREECGELEDAARGGDSERAEAELGDALLAAVVLARRLDLDPELALRRAVLRFRTRFAAIEPRLGEADLDELVRLWDEAAREE